MVIHVFKVEVDSKNKNWHDVADELANAAVDADNSIENIRVFLSKGEHEASR